MKKPEKQKSISKPTEFSSVSTWIGDSVQGGMPDTMNLTEIERNFSFWMKSIPSWIEKKDYIHVLDCVKYLDSNKGKISREDFIRFWELFVRQVGSLNVWEDIIKSDARYKVFFEGIVRWLLPIEEKDRPEVYLLAYEATRCVHFAYQASDNGVPLPDTVFSTPFLQECFRTLEISDPFFAQKRADFLAIIEKDLADENAVDQWKWLDAKPPTKINFRGISGCLKRWYEDPRQKEFRKGLITRISSHRKYQEMLIHREIREAETRLVKLRLQEKEMLKGRSCTLRELADELDADWEKKFFACEDMEKTISGKEARFCLYGETKGLAAEIKELKAKKDVLRRVVDEAFHKKYEVDELVKSIEAENEKISGGIKVSVQEDLDFLPPAFDCLLDCTEEYLPKDTGDSRYEKFVLPYLFLREKNQLDFAGFSENIPDSLYTELQYIVGWRTGWICAIRLPAVEWKLRMKDSLEIPFSAPISLSPYQRKPMKSVYDTERSETPLAQFSKKLFDLKRSYEEESAPVEAWKEREKADLFAELFSLCDSSRDGVDEGQIVGVIEFFKEHPDLLSMDDGISLLHQVLFRDSLLLEELKKPKTVHFFVENLKGFFQAGISTSIAMKDYSKAAQLMFCMSSVQSYCDVCKTSRMCTDVEMKNWIDILVEKVAEIEDEKVKGVVFEALFASVRQWTEKSPPDEYFATAALLHILWKNFPNDNIDHPFLVRSRTAKEVEKQLQTIFSLSNMEDFSPILTQSRTILAPLFPGISSASFTKTSGFQYEARDNGSIDIVSGSFTAASVHAALRYDKNIPDDVMHELKKYIPESIRTGLKGQLKDGVWYIKTQDGRQIRCDDADKSIFIKISVYGQPVWMRGVTVAPEDMPYREFSRRYICFQFSEVRYFCDPKTLDVRYRYGVDGEIETEYRTEKVVPAPEKFHAFEDPTCTVCLQNREGTITQVEFPRLQLTLVRDEKSKKMRWKENPEYFFSEDQFVPHMHSAGALVFEKEKDPKIKKVLLPVHQLKKDTVFYSYEMDEQQRQISCVQYDLLGTDVVPETFLGRFYLAELLIKNKTYDLAEKLLDDAAAFIRTRGCTQEERDILERVSLFLNSESNDPRLTRLRLQALLILEKNSYQFPHQIPKKDMADADIAAEQKKRNESFNKLFTEYLQRYRGVKPISEEDELFLLQRFAISSPACIARQQELMIKQSPEIGINPLPVDDLVKECILPEDSSSLSSEGDVLKPGGFLGLVDGIAYKIARSFNRVPFNIRSVSPEKLRRYTYFMKKDLEGTDPRNAKYRDRLYQTSVYFILIRKEEEIKELGRSIYQPRIEKTKTLLMEQDGVLSQRRKRPELFVDVKTLPFIQERKAQDINELDRQCGVIADSYIKKKTIDSPTVNPDEMAFLSAESPEIEGSAVANAFEETKKDLEAAAQKASSEVYSEEGSALEALSTELDKNISDATKELADLESEILRSVAFALNQDSVFMSDVKAKRKRYPDISELCMICAREDAGDFLQKTYPQLTSVLGVLRENTKYFLLKKQFLQQCVKSKDLVDTARSLPEKSDDRKVAVQIAGEALYSKRAYDVNDPHALLFLIMENVSGFKLRAGQVEGIKKFIAGAKDDPQVLQMIMGAGKTSVLQPLLGILLSHKDFLSTVDVPESLFVEVRQQLEKFFGPSFSQYIHLLDYHRDYISGDDGVDYLKMFLKKLIDIKTESGIWLRIPRMKHSVLTSFDEVYEQYTTEQDGGKKALLKEKMDLLCVIAKLLDTKEGVQFDEIDTTMDPFITFKYPIGVPGHMEEKRALAITDMLLDVADVLSKEIKLDFIDKMKKLPADDDRPRFDEKDYAKIKEKLAEKAYERLKTQYPKTCDEAHKKMVLDFLLQRSDVDQGLDPRKYEKLCSKSLEEVKKAEDSREKTKILYMAECNEWIKNASGKDEGDATEVIGTCALALNEILETTLCKVCGVHYGKDTENQKNLTAIPYAAADAPKLRMAFADVYMLHAYSVQNIIFDGISFEAARTMFLLMREQVREDVRGGTELDKTVGYRLFDHALHDEASRFFEEPIKDDLIEKFRFAAARDRELLKKFVATYLVQQEKIYSQSVSSTAQSLAGSCASAGGYTGTLSPGILHPRMKAVPELGTDGKTILAIQRKMAAETATTKEYTGNKLQEVLRTFAEDPRMRVFIDSGGWLKDEPVSEFAKKMYAEAVKKSPALEGVIYHNKKREIVLLRKLPDGSFVEEPFPIGPLYKAEDKYLTIIAQRFETGTNIPQIPTAKALMSVRKGMTKRDALQSAFRMRKILEGQSVSFAFGEDVSSQIRSRIVNGLVKKLTNGADVSPDVIAALPPDIRESFQKYWMESGKNIETFKEVFLKNFPITSSAVWRYFIVNEALLQQQKNWIAAQQKMREVIEKSIRVALEDKDISIDDRVALFKTIRRLVFETTIDSPFSRVSKVKVEKNAEDAIKEAIEAHMQFVSDIKELGENEAAKAVLEDMARRYPQDTGGVRGALERCVDKKIIPARIRCGVEAAGQEQEAQAEQQAEQQAQAEQQSEKEAEKEQEGQTMRIPFLTPEKHIPLLGGGSVESLFSFQGRGVISCVDDLKRVVYLKEESVFKGSTALFGPLYVSKNLFPYHTVTSPSNLPSRYIMALVYPTETKYVLLSQRDAMDVRKALAANPRKTKGHSIVVMGYDGAVIASNQQPGEKVPSEGDQFKKIVLLAKLLTAKSKYSKEEVELLKSIILDKEGKIIHQQLVDDICDVMEASMMRKEVASAVYAGSSMRKFLLECRHKLHGKEIEEFLQEKAKEWGEDMGLGHYDYANRQIVVAIIESRASRKQIFTFLKEHKILLEGDWLTSLYGCIGQKYEVNSFVTDYKVFYERKQ